MLASNQESDDLRFDIQSKIQNLKSKITSRWAILDSNQGPHPYQGCALTT
jgi:hypothetical protein